MQKILISIFILFLILGFVILGTVFSNNSHEKLSYPMAHEIIDRWLLGRLQHEATGEVIYILIGENFSKNEIKELANYYRVNKKYKYLTIYIFNNKKALSEYHKSISSDALYLKSEFIRKHLICTIGVDIVDNESHKDDEIIMRGFDEKTNTTIYERELTEAEIKIENEKSKKIDYEAKYKKMVLEGASIDMIVDQMKKDKLIYASQVLKLMHIFNLDHEKASKIISDSGTSKP